MYLTIFLRQALPLDGGLPQVFWLISNIQIYLTGFLKCRKRPKTSKKIAQIRASRTSARGVYHARINHDRRLLELTFGKGEGWISFLACALGKARWRNALRDSPLVLSLLPLGEGTLLLAPSTSFEAVRLTQRPFSPGEKDRRIKGSRSFSSLAAHMRYAFARK